MAVERGFVGFMENVKNLDAERDRVEEHYAAGLAGGATSRMGYVSNIMGQGDDNEAVREVGISNKNFYCTKYPVSWA